MFDRTTEQKALVRAAARFCAEHADLPELTGDGLTRAGASTKPVREGRFISSPARRKRPGEVGG